MRYMPQVGFATFEDACRDQDARIATAQIRALPTADDDSFDPSPDDERVAREAAKG